MKVGDYVRTLNGKIWIIKSQKAISGHKKDILMSSPNIIDLIEVGDYVNGRYVDKYQGKLGNFCELPNGKWEFIEISNEHYLISSIVTREQFENCMYKIGE